MGLDLHVAATWWKTKQNKVYCENTEKENRVWREEKFKVEPGLCLMLSLEPHLDVTLLTSTFLFKICTWRRVNIHDNAACFCIHFIHFRKLQSFIIIPHRRIIQQNTCPVSLLSLKVLLCFNMINEAKFMQTNNSKHQAVNESMHR